jgi:hypothetical protein
MAGSFTSAFMRLYSHFSIKRSNFLISRYWNSSTTNEGRPAIDLVRQTQHIAGPTSELPTTHSPLGKANIAPQ